MFRKPTAILCKCQNMQNIFKIISYLKKNFLAHTDFIECDSCHRLFSVTTSEVGRRKNEVSKAGIHSTPSPKRVHKIEKGKGES